MITGGSFKSETNEPSCIILKDFDKKNDNDSINARSYHTPDLNQSIEDKVIKKQEEEEKQKFFEYVIEGPPQTVITSNDHSKFASNIPSYHCSKNSKNRIKEKEMGVEE